MAYAGRGTEEDFSGVDLQGKIALIEGGGGVSLREKVEGAGEAGAEAAVIFNEGVEQLEHPGIGYIKTRGFRPSGSGIGRGGGCCGLWKRGTA